jgi:hypothetical protein
MKAVNKQSRKRLNTLIIPIPWELWKHHNLCIFNNVTPVDEVVRTVIVKELHGVIPGPRILGTWSWL